MGGEGRILFLHVCSRGAFKFFPFRCSVSFAFAEADIFPPNSLLADTCFAAVHVQVLSLGTIACVHVRLI